MLKSAIGDLAVFGGEPAFKNSLHVGRPNIGDRNRLVERIDNILERNWLTNGGPFVREFEARIAEKVGARHCVVTSSGTVALELAIRAVGMSGEVIVPSFTFVSTAHALEWQGIKPVFCDIEAEGYNIDPEQVERQLTPRVTGIIAVHIFGRPANVDALSQLAERKGLSLIFDACHAFGCSHQGRMIGTFGDAEVFSFHATKIINSFEGGAVVTSNDGLADSLRRLKNFGFTGDAVRGIGINAKMSEVSAAMGLTSLESMDQFVAVNRKNYYRYRDRLQDIPGIRLLEFNERESNNYQYIIVDVDEVSVGLKRDELMSLLSAERVLARRYFHPGCHNMEPYLSRLPHERLTLPVTDRVVRRVLCLPTGCEASYDEIDKVCELIRFAAAHGTEIGCRLAKSAPNGKEPPRSKF